MLTIFHPTYFHFPRSLNVLNVHSILKNYVLIMKIYFVNNFLTNNEQ